MSFLSSKFESLIFLYNYKNKMLFQAEYWFAKTDNEKIETIEQFVADDYLRNLVILDKQNFDVISIIKELSDMDDLFCKVVIMNNDESSISFNDDEDDKIKTIYIYHDLELAKPIIEKHTPMLAFFE